MRAIAAALVLLAAAPAQASVALRATTDIAEGERFEISPFTVELRFPQAVQLVGARLVDQDGKDAPLDLSFYRARAEAFTIELPVLLPHGYRLIWKVRSAAGAEQSGSVGFLVTGCDDPREVARRR